jgi:hypothetical protein
MRTLLNDGECLNITEAVFSRWDSLYARFSTKRIGGDGGGGEGGDGGGGDDENIECGSCGVPFFVPAYMMGGTEGIACPHCEKPMCTEVSKI